MHGFRTSDLALLARANFAQEFPRVNAEVVIVIPLEADGVLPNTFGGKRFGGGFEHGQGAWRRFRGLTRRTAGFVALFVAHGAGAGVAQENESVMRGVGVGPNDVHASSGG
jgi:hypothetical protein